MCAKRRGRPEIQILILNCKSERTVSSDHTDRSSRCRGWSEHLSISQSCQQLTAIHHLLWVTDESSICHWTLGVCESEQNEQTYRRHRRGFSLAIDQSGHEWDELNYFHCAIPFICCTLWHFVNFSQHQPPPAASIKTPYIHCSLLVTLFRGLVLKMCALNCAEESVCAHKYSGCLNSVPFCKNAILPSKVTFKV